MWSQPDRQTGRERGEERKRGRGESETKKTTLRRERRREENLLCSSQLSNSILQLLPCGRQLPFKFLCCGSDTLNTGITFNRRNVSNHDRRGRDLRAKFTFLEKKNKMIEIVRPKERQKGEQDRL